MSNPALYFHPEPYTLNGPKLMGRNAAGASFLKGFLKHSSTREFWIQVDNPEHAKIFADAAKEAKRREPIFAVTGGGIGELRKPGLLYCPGPGLGSYAWQRNPFGHGAWSLCGVTHTTASAGAMDSIAELLVAPLQNWDALICTSSAVKSHVRNVLQAQADYLNRRLGAYRIPSPQLPVIPLGINAEEFEVSADDRAASRKALGFGESDVVILFVGRLSFHAKAHPLAMYRALERAAARLGSNVRLHLLECGWHANSQIAAAFKKAAEAECPSVPCQALDGRRPEVRRAAWSAADIFCSLSDNIQETFGLAPIEAMAAGLPVIVSDWDGYKDTVEHGTVGFRIPTVFPPAGAASDLAFRHAAGVDNYDMYCGHVSALTAVDIDAATDAIATLGGSADLRRKMGEAGKARAKTSYGWKSILRRYEELWSELTAIRAIATGNTPQPPEPWPARLDPFTAFASYPTRTLDGRMIVRLASRNKAEAYEIIDRSLKLEMVNFAQYVIPDRNEIDHVLELLAVTHRTLADLAEQVPVPRQAYIARTLTWLAKLGVVRFDP